MSLALSLAVGLSVGDIGLRAKPRLDSLSTSTCASSDLRIGVKVPVSLGANITLTS